MLDPDPAEASDGSDRMAADKEAEEAEGESWKRVEAEEGERE